MRRILVIGLDPHALPARTAGRKLSLEIRSQDERVARGICQVVCLCRGFVDILAKGKNLLDHAVIEASDVNNHTRPFVGSPIAWNEK